LVAFRNIILLVLSLRTSRLNGRLLLPFLVFSSAYCATPKDDDGYDPKGKVEDMDDVGLSHVGNAAYNVLRIQHNYHHHKLWHRKNNDECNWRKHLGHFLEKQSLC
jgi:hypothetical protein